MKNERDDVIVDSTCNVLVVHTTTGTVPWYLSLISSLPPGGSYFGVLAEA